MQPLQQSIPVKTGHPSDALLPKAVSAKKVALCFPGPRVWLSTFPAGCHLLSFPSSPEPENTVRA